MLSTSAGASTVVPRRSLKISMGAPTALPHAASFTPCSHRHSGIELGIWALLAERSETGRWFLAERVPHPGCTERPEADHHRTSVDNIGTDTAFVLESSGALGIELPPLARSTTHGIWPIRDLWTIESGVSHLAWIC
ncbi:hypothetical protein NDU88_005348 [Pleurodeles waltl]|uniref:Uncharacterized protein n=1 Tax=Pleurodeles waltl TaxID=8319 RepID=A0AAV7VN32_PLEWA|nr:hypothetical protein NDU88_005348 [Pleurodeles waltl]